MRSLTAASLMAGALLLTIGNAQAAPYDLYSSNANMAIYYGSFAQGDFPAQTEQAIYFDGSNNVTGSFGSIGVNNNAHDDIYFSSNSSLKFANGLAQVDGYDQPGSTPPVIWHDLTISVNPGFKFTDFIFRSIGPNDVTIKAYDIANSLVGTYSFPDLDPADPSSSETDYKRIMVLAEGSTLFSKLVLTSDAGWGSMKDMDISGWGVIPNEAPESVPLPAAVWLFGSMLAGGAGLFSVRRRRGLVQSKKVGLA